MDRLPSIHGYIHIQQILKDKIFVGAQKPQNP